MHYVLSLTNGIKVLCPIAFVAWLVFSPVLRGLESLLNTILSDMFVKIQ